MRIWIAALATLLLVNCSCQRGTTEHTNTAKPAAREPAATGKATATPDAAIATPHATPTNGQSLRAATAVVHEYIGVLLNDRQAAAKFWAGGSFPPRPDDAVLHALNEVRNLRITNGAGIALDQNQPPQAIEIPVQLRISTADGLVRLHGWYRVRPRVGSGDWEITSASLQPVLD